MAKSGVSGSVMAALAKAYQVMKYHGANGGGMAARGGINGYGGMAAWRRRRHHGVNKRGAQNTANRKRTTPGGENNVA
jgi:hypothetical protein